jgi:hypothetical protein
MDSFLAPKEPCVVGSHDIDEFFIGFLWAKWDSRVELRVLSNCFFVGNESPLGSNELEG